MPLGLPGISIHKKWRMVQSNGELIYYSFRENKKRTVLSH